MPTSQGNAASSGAKPRFTPDDIGPVDNAHAFGQAEHRRRYAHRESIVFQDRNAGWYCVAYSKAAIKRAMLAVGSRGHFYVYGGGGHPAHVRWREACARFLSAGCRNH
jgi:hypothetical protein